MKGQERIEEMYAYIVVDDDGTEGIPAFLAPDGMAMPLVGADMARALSLLPAAEDIARRHKKPVTLVKFTNRVEVRKIE